MAKYSFRWADGCMVNWHVQGDDRMIAMKEDDERKKVVCRFMAFMAYMSFSWTAFMACAKGCVQIHGIHGIHVIFMDRIHGMQKGLRADSWHSDISFSWTAFMACMSFSWEAFNLKQWKLCKNSDWKWLARLEAVPAPVSSNASPIVCGTHQSRRHVNCHCYNRTCFLIDCHVKFISKWLTWTFCWGRTLFGPSTAWHKAWHLDDMLTCSMVTWWQLTMTTRSMILVTRLFHGCL